MAKRTLKDLAAGLESWDGDVNDNWDVLGQDNNPMSMPEESVPAGLQAANLHDRSAIWVNHATMGWTLFGCDGTNYFPCQGFAIMNFANISSTATTLSLKAWNSGGLVSSGPTSGLQHCMPCELLLVHGTSTGYHQHGSDPGDWTITINNVDDSTNVTMTHEWSSSNNTQLASTGGVSGTLAFSAGDHIEVESSGPSVTTIRLMCSLLFLVRVPPTGM